MQDEWSRVGEYLDRLAFENDRLEAELKLKKERRAERESLAEAAPQHSIEREDLFNEKRETARYESRTVADTAQGMRLSYDALRNDLSGLMSDLNDFKSTRAGLESRFSRQP